MFSPRHRHPRGKTKRASFLDVNRIPPSFPPFPPIVFSFLQFLPHLSFSESPRPLALSVPFPPEEVLYENKKLSKIENWLLEFLDMLEVLLVERRVDESLVALEDAESIAEETKKRQTLSQTNLLSLVLLRLFRPCVEQALNTNLKRIEQSSSALAAADDWSFAFPTAGMGLGSTTSLGSTMNAS